MQLIFLNVFHNKRFNIYFSAEYPFINYYVIHKTRDEAAAIFREARSQAYNAFSPDKTGYCSAHTFDKYDEVPKIFSKSFLIIFVGVFENYLRKKQPLCQINESK